MWIPVRYKELGRVNIDDALKAIEALPDSLWYAEEEIKKNLAGKRPTQSLFLYSIDKHSFLEHMADRAIKQEDVPKLGVYEELAPVILPLAQAAAAYYPVGGVFVRIQLARMLPGTVIEPHCDTSVVLKATHRLHIPIVTNKEVRFVVDDELIEMRSGHIYELNNRVTHSVHNPPAAPARIHLIIDYLPPQFNSRIVIGENFDFHVRKLNAKPVPIKEYPPVKLPKVIVTSVVRGAHQSDSHGGIYLVDMQSGDIEKKVDWNTCNIDFSGRGWDRGLRGICFYDGYVLIAASDEIFVYDQQFNLIESYKTPYLRHAHEMYIDGRYMYVASTGFDSILRFNLRKKKFDKGWHLFAQKQLGLSVLEFDPNLNDGPKPSNVFHINNMFFEKKCLYISGRKLNALIKVDKGQLSSALDLPLGTHNVVKYNKGFLYNDTNSNQVVYSTIYDYRAVDVPTYENSKLLNNELGDEQLARQGFGRGLCAFKSGIVLVGSSPSTITAYDFRNKTRIKSVNITMDIRNAVHGLEIWPF